MTVAAKDEKKLVVYVYADLELTYKSLHEIDPIMNKMNQCLSDKRGFIINYVYYDKEIAVKRETGASAPLSPPITRVTVYCMEKEKLYI